MNKRKRDGEANRKHQKDYEDRHKAAGRTRRGYYATPEGHVKLKRLERELIDEGDK